MTDAFHSQEVLLSFPDFSLNSLSCKHGPGVGHKLEKKKLLGIWNHCCWLQISVAKLSVYRCVKISCFAFILIWAAVWIGICSFRFFSLYPVTQIQSEELWCPRKVSDLSIWETRVLPVLVQSLTWWVSMGNSINSARPVFQSGKNRGWVRPVVLKAWSLDQCVNITSELTKNANLGILFRTYWIRNCRSGGCKTHYFNKWPLFILMHA